LEEEEPPFIDVDIVISEEEAVDFDVPMVLSKLVVSLSGDEFNELIMGICCEFPMIPTAVLLRLALVNHKLIMIPRSHDSHFAFWSFGVFRLILGGNSCALLSRVIMKTNRPKYVLLNIYYHDMLDIINFYRT
jgi:hypothetical protein